MAIKTPPARQRQQLGLQFTEAGDHTLMADVKINNANSNPLLGLQNGAVVTYQGKWDGNGNNTNSNFNVLNDSHLTIGEDATINLVLDDNHQFTRQLWVYGDGTGRFELAPDFTAEQTLSPDDPVAMGSIRNRGVTLITHDSQSLPQYTRRYVVGGLERSHLNGHIDLEMNAPVWRIDSNAQSYGGGVNVHTNSTIETLADLRLTGNYIFTEDNFNAFGGLHLNEGVTLSKLGAATLFLDGDQAYRPGSTIAVEEGGSGF